MLQIFPLIVQYSWIQAIVAMCVVPPTLYFLLQPSGARSWFLFWTAVWLICRYFARGGQCKGISKGRLDNKVVIVTGGNTGIGLETCRILCFMGAQVVLACRDAAKGGAALRSIRATQPNAKITMLSLDISSRASIEAFVREFRSLERPLNILVNNAGVMMCPYGTTVDGFETQVGTNFLGHHLLTHLLLPDLLKSKGNRVVNVSSLASLLNTPGGLNDKIDFEKYLRRPPGKGFQERTDMLYSYAVSKLGNALHSRALHSLYGPKGLTSVSLHPGVITSDLFKYLVPAPVWLLLKWTLLPTLFQTVTEGAQTTIHCCISEDVKGGEWYHDCRKSSATHPMVFNDEQALEVFHVANRAWKITAPLPA